MLFVYNHDQDYDKNFFEMLFSPVKRKGAKKETAVKVENLPISYGQSIHIVESKLINYLTTVVADANALHKAERSLSLSTNFFILN